MYGDSEQGGIKSHISDPDFGANLEFFSVIQELITKAPKLSPIEIQLLLRDRYETFFGIYNHDADTGQRPFSLIALQQAEDFSLIDPIKLKTDLFIDRDVHKYTGLSIDKFFDLPTFRCSEILEACAKRKKEESKAAQNVQNQLNNIKAGEPGKK